jgi:hypothetical protein
VNSRSRGPLQSPARAGAASRRPHDACASYGFCPRAACPGFHQRRWVPRRPTSHCFGRGFRPFRRVGRERPSEGLAKPRAPLLEHLPSTRVTEARHRRGDWRLHPDAPVGRRSASAATPRRAATSEGSRCFPPSRNPHDSAHRPSRAFECARWIAPPCTLRIGPLSRRPHVAVI